MLYLPDPTLIKHDEMERQGKNDNVNFLLSGSNIMKIVFV